MWECMLEMKDKLLLYADDAVIVSENGDELQSMFDCITEYGRDFNVRFSPEKSQVLVVNGTVEDVDRVWQLGGNVIGMTKEYMYLGVNVNQKGCEKTKALSLSKANQWLGILGSAARVRASKYEVLREVWKSVAVPGIMYGMDVIAWNDGELDKLEVVQNRIARLALGAPRWTAVEALRGDMGWSTFNERRMKAALRYKVRLERMNDERWARKMYLWNMRVSKWNRKCHALVRKCDLNEIWAYPVHNRQGDEWLMTVQGVSGIEWDVKEWKKEIEKRVRICGLRIWKQGMGRKDSLKLYRMKEMPKYECIYDGSRGGDLMFCVRANALSVNARTYRWNERREDICFMCNSGERETVEHLMMECEAYESERLEMIGVILDERGEGDGVMYERTGDEWMAMIVGLSPGVTTAMTDSGKRFLEGAWRMRERRRLERVEAGRM